MTTFFSVPFPEQDTALALKLSARLSNDPSSLLREALKMLAGELIPVAIQPPLLADVFTQAPAKSSPAPEKPKRKGSVHRGPDRGDRKPHKKPMTISEFILSQKGTEMTSREMAQKAKDQGLKLRQASISSIMSALASEKKIHRVTRPGVSKYNLYKIP